ncbi:hypothetical protein SADUNF_Sadunf06G0077300 [Salix dunnii]|uniref:Uncharacterized protein n=1 Tax=Salix dunnii TaxID=1413687 RepID=A0A835K623_9ROSI|nr:hypothetical protein SADUNF_Sadunf06G0077300 [Salix dunnii]
MHHWRWRLLDNHNWRRVSPILMELMVVVTIVGLGKLCLPQPRCLPECFSGLVEAEVHPSQKEVGVVADCLQLHVFWVGNGELEGLFPYWIEVSVFCGGSYFLTVKFCNDIGTGASLTVFGEKITCVDYFYQYFPNGEINQKKEKSWGFGGKVKKRRWVLWFDLDLDKEREAGWMIADGKKKMDAATSYGCVQILVPIDRLRVLNSCSFANETFIKEMNACKHGSEDGNSVAKKSILGDFIVNDNMILSCQDQELLLALVPKLIHSLKLIVRITSQITGRLIPIPKHEDSPGFINAEDQKQKIRQMTSEITEEKDSDAPCFFNTEDQKRRIRQIIEHQKSFTSLRRLFDMEHTSLATHFQDYSGSPIIKPIPLLGSDTENEVHDPWASIRQIRTFSEPESDEPSKLASGSCRDDEFVSKDKKAKSRKLTRKKSFRTLPGFRVWRFSFRLRLKRLRIMICGKIF